MVMVILASEQNPIQQGLKHTYNTPMLGASDVLQNKIQYNKGWNAAFKINGVAAFEASEQNPIQQGLKHAYLQFVVVKYLLASEQNPIQQGLKLFSCNLLMNPSVASEQNPIQQGLKQAQPYFLGLHQLSFRTKSNTTRVETHGLSTKMCLEHSFRTKSNTTRVETLSRRS